jgi:hypothetical protein
MVEGGRTVRPTQLLDVHWGSRDFHPLLVAGGGVRRALRRACRPWRRRRLWRERWAGAAAPCRQWRSVSGILMAFEMLAMGFACTRDNPALVTMQLCIHPSNRRPLAFDIWVARFTYCLLAAPHQLVIMFLFFWLHLGGRGGNRVIFSSDDPFSDWSSMSLHPTPADCLAALLRL